jgi:hypothetical protein
MTPWWRRKRKLARPTDRHLASKGRVSLRSFRAPCVPPPRHRTRPIHAQLIAKTLRGTRGNTPLRVRSLVLNRNADGTPASRILISHSGNQV